MHQRTPGVVSVALFILCACTTNNEASRQAVSSAAPNVVDLSIDGHTFRAPDTLEAGWTTFKFANNGDDVHYAHIIRLESGRTAEELLNAYAEAIRTSAERPTWLTRFGGPGGTVPADTSNVTQYLEPGRYVWLCPVEDNAGTPHFSKGEFATFVVQDRNSGTAEAAAAPTATTSILLEDYSFAVDSTLTAGHHTVRVRNIGAQGHDLVMMKLEPGKTAEDVARSLNPERARRPDQKDQPAEPLESLGRPEGGIATIRSGMEVFFTTTLTPGEYALICMTTAPDGRSHIEHGMIQQIRIH
jgi:hypothetical protein